MPIYEYECMACGKIEEAVQKISDPPLETCSTCSGKLTKLISQSTFHLKGGGWYVTDYANKSTKSADSSPPKEGSAKSPKTEKAPSPSGDTKSSE